MPFPLEIEYVRTTEAKLGVAFPADHVASMQRDNGGTVRVPRQDWYFELHPFLDESSTKRMMRTCNDIVRETVETRRGWGELFPARAIVIGKSDADRMVLLPRAGDDGPLEEFVYRWDHETSKVSLLVPRFRDLERL